MLGAKIVLGSAFLFLISFLTVCSILCMLTTIQFYILIIHVTFIDTSGMLVVRFIDHVHTGSSSCAVHAVQNVFMTAMDK